MIPSCPLIFNVLKFDTLFMCFTPVLTDHVRQIDRLKAGAPPHGLQREESHA